MPVLVIDASLAAAWCFPDERTEYADGVLQAISDSSEALAPRLWAYEIRNSILVGLRRGRNGLTVYNAASGACPPRECATRQPGHRVAKSGHERRGNFVRAPG
jgi:hypothetical protein